MGRAWQSLAEPARQGESPRGPQGPELSPTATATELPELALGLRLPRLPRGQPLLREVWLAFQVTPSAQEPPLQKHRPAKSKEGFTRLWSPAFWASPWRPLKIRDVDQESPPRPPPASWVFLGAPGTSSTPRSLMEEPATLSLR